MKMSRYIIGRIVAISVAILLVGLALALWRAQFDVNREARGAADEVRLFEYLYALENGPAAQIDANVEALRRIVTSRNLRHVRFTLRDGDVLEDHEPSVGTGVVKGTMPLDLVMLAQDDHAPCGVTLNEADWRPGNILLEEYAVTIPADTPSGEYPVEIGLYEDSSGTRLPVLSSALDHDVDSVILGKIQIK